MRGLVSSRRFGVAGMVGLAAVVSVAGLMILGFPAPWLFLAAVIVELLAALWATTGTSIPFFPGEPQPAPVVAPAIPRKRR